MCLREVGAFLRQMQKMLVDFNMEPVDHLKMTPDEAEEFGAYLIQTAKEARGGKVIMTPFSGL